MPASSVIGRVVIVGGGLMGHGIAQVFAVAGADVAVYDPAPEALESVRSRIADNLRRLGLDPSVADGLELATDMEAAVADARWVFEAAPEDLELKQTLFERLDRAAPADAILATNSSVMRVGDVGVRAQRPERIVGTHWWNPPFLIQLVEVVQGDATAEQTVRQTLDLLTALGKTPVHVRRDVPGFVGNRLQHALWREAFQLVDNGVCDPETVDTVVKLSFGRRLGVLGPMENADLVGLDLTLAIHEYLLPHLDPPSRPSDGLRARVDGGELGMGTGSGWRRWTTSEADDVRRRVLAALSEPV